MTRSEVEQIAQALYYGSEEHGFFPPLLDALCEFGYEALVSVRFSLQWQRTLTDPVTFRLIAMIQQGSWDEVDRIERWCKKLLKLKPPRY